eukprot:CAMPEP_0198289052 /NCGR_PEP_ID=MMETSP1449-20131203/7378_1 /TAXON_ID=420275 /ORGANISM="Attheya septentrionalis, Strain CCMP2084" /LENGTH=421 /DNA_ID=CAMNT_0043987319 /DNA_START=118 /DNA_END=1383 /DNA_ORIENTATION=-
MTHSSRDHAAHWGLSCASFLLFTAVSVLVGTTSAFGVVKRDTPLLMEKLVLGTVALPNVPGGSFQLLSDAYERGFCRFDLARSYGGGKCEELFGQWLDKSGVNREDLLLITKGGMGNDKYGDPNRPMCSKESIQSELSASLEALKTDYVDMYMLHRDDPRISAGQFVEWMNELREDGLIRAWGVSNWNLKRLEQAHDYAISRGLMPPSATSPQLSLAVPSDEVWPTTHSLSCPSKVGEIEWYKANGVEIMGWEALAKGFMAVPTLWREHEVNLSTFHGPDAEIGSETWRMQRIQRAYCTQLNYARRRIATQLAKESGMSLAQVALLYSLAKGEHVSVLVGADRCSHLDEMAAIRDWSLDDEAFNCLTAATKKSSVVSRVAAEIQEAKEATVSLQKKVLVTPSTTQSFNETMISSVVEPVLA